MRILEINIQNFRKLLQCHIEFSEKTTLFVGANNSGKTSAMDALGKFLADRNFTFNDITISERSAINVIGERWIQKDCEEPTTITEWESLMPKMDIWLNVASNEMHYVACIIPTLKWRGGKLGVRLAFFPKDIVKLFTDYRDAYFAAREVEKAKENVEIRLYPINLSEFLEKNLNTYFSIKTYILDEAKEEQGNPQETPFEMECFIDNPLKKIIKVDMIDAQRGFTDPDNTDGTIRSKQQLSEERCFVTAMPCLLYRHFYQKVLLQIYWMTIIAMQMQDRHEDASSQEKLLLRKGYSMLLIEETEMESGLLIRSLALMMH